MAGKEYDPTNNKGRGKEAKKGLPSESHESSKEKIPSEDTRGVDSLMAETVYKQRIAKKQSLETKSQDFSAESSSQVSPRPIFAEALFIREFQRMSGEIQKLRTENEEYKEKEEHRKEQQRKRAEKWRESHPETHKERERERYRNRRIENQ